MRRLEIYLIFLIILCIIGFSVYHYIFSIYEVNYKITPDSLFADNSSTIVIEAIPINSFGWKAPFRKPHADFSLNEGNDLVDIILLDNDNGVLKLKARDKSGKVSITIKSIYSLLPSTIEIIIEPNII